MDSFSSRTVSMLGQSGYDALKGSTVAVFGIGGVGGYAVEALARAGVGTLVLVDSDRVSESNINRQIIATHDTVGQYKTEAARARILSINPKCRVITHNLFFAADTADSFDFTKYDYVIDAIDSVSSKVELISRATAQGTKIISAMGAGNKLDPTRFRVSDISKTTVCPLAKAVRVALRKKGINHLKVVFSDEPPTGALTASDEAATAQACNSQAAQSEKLAEAPASDRAAGKILEESPASDRAACTANESLAEPTAQGANTTPQSPESTLDDRRAYAARRAPGSISFVPSVMGLILAGEVIKDIAL